MTRILPVLILGLALPALAACGSPPQPAAPALGSVATPPEHLMRIVERYWDEQAAVGNALSPQFMADSLDLERRFLAEVLAVPRTQLDADSKLTYDIFRRRRELAIEGFTYPAELLPINPFEGMWQEMARAPADNENWLLRIDDFSRWSAQAIVNMREGLRRGYTVPRVLIERLLPALEQLGADLKDPVRTHLSQSVAAAVKGKLLPALRELHDFLKNEYLPRTRVSLALSALPLGESWYAYRVKRATSSVLSPSEIHTIGKAEADRLKGRMQMLLAGGAAAPRSKDPVELLNAYKELKVRTLAAMPALFSAVPSAEFEIRDFEQAITQGGPAAFDPSRFLQETIPGRLYLRKVEQGRADLPRFRRVGGEPAFVDGWGLYAASLGDDLGTYQSDDAKLASLQAQLRCAAALVVDTGLHSQGWTRVQALDYLHAELAVDDADANLSIDRYAALPGDALACKVGELKFQSLRTRAQQTLGARFDPRAFHAEILKGGAMPLDLLEANMKAWMAAPR